MIEVTFVGGPLDGRRETIPVENRPDVIEFGFVPAGAVLNGHDTAALDRLTELAGVYRRDVDGPPDRYVWGDWRPTPDRRIVAALPQETEVTPLSRFLDGPAGPTSLANGRSPVFLRVVIDPAGKVDCLDQLEDTPAKDETIHLYELVPGTDHGRALVMLARPRRCVWMASGDYRHRPDVDGETLRETSAWRAWVEREAEARGMLP